MPRIRSIDSLSHGSLQKLRTCDIRLQKVVELAIQRLPWTLFVIYGFRNKDAQELAYRQKATQLHYPNSKHNCNPSLAIDIAPMIMPGKIDWENEISFNVMADAMLNAAESLGYFTRLDQIPKGKTGNIGLRLGVDWDMDGLRRERGTFECDGPHFELVLQGETIAGVKIL